MGKAVNNIRNTKITELNKLIETKTAEHDIKRKELTDVEECLGRQRNVLSSLKKQELDGESRLVAIARDIELKTKQCIDLDANLLTLRTRVERSGQMIEKNLEAVKGQNDQILINNSLLSSLQEREKSQQQTIENLVAEKSKLVSEIETLEEKKSKIEALSVAEGTSVEKSRKEQEKISKEITEALEAFKIFEGRIANLSQETGYIIGYKSPSKK